MKPLAWMIGTSLASWLAASAFFGSSVNPEFFLGMAGPLAAASATWWLVERTARAEPERLTNVMVTAFAAKMVFFGAYATVILGVFALRPIPFVASFTGYFVALHLATALTLKGMRQKA